LIEILAPTWRTESLDFPEQSFKEFKGDLAVRLIRLPIAKIRASSFDSLPNSLSRAKVAL